MTGRATRVLVTGAGGLLGRDLVPRLEAAGYDVVAADHARLDVADRDAVLGAITGTAPDVVVHAAAWTAVDACEGDPERAYRVNALGCRHVADGARRVGAHVVALSTDYVFDGEQERPYVEWDAPNPRSAYGRSKRGGELELDPGSALVRTAWVNGAHGGGIVKTVLRLAAGDGELRFVDDQRGCPTFTTDLADALVQLVAARLPGTFHLTNGGATTWYGFVGEVLAAAGHDPARVVPITTAELDPPRPALRPANSVLDNLAWRALGFDPLPDHRDALRRFLAELGA